MKFFIMFLLAVMISVTAFSSDDIEFDHSRFYQAKEAIRHELIETTKEVGFIPTENDFKSVLERRLAQVIRNTPQLDYTVLTSSQDGALIVITLIGYNDEKGFIGWKFDTVIVENSAYFFSATLPDRMIPELKPEDYYQWHRMKNE